MFLRLINPLEDTEVTLLNRQLINVSSRDTDEKIEVVLQQLLEELRVWKQARWNSRITPG